MRAQALSVTGQSGRHSNAERKLDLYETPECATRALLRAENLPARIWEPAAGRGAIARVLRWRGHEVIASDIHDYGDLHFVGDFLQVEKAPPHVEAIVTNPPFRLAAEFVAHGLRLAPKVVMLLRLAFLESERRSSILDTGKLARVLVFRNRLPMLHRDGWAGPKASSAIAFAWYVFDRNHNGPVILDRISWVRP
jgi:hypothetical protein